MYVGYVGFFITFFWREKLKKEKEYRKPYIPYIGVRVCKHKPPSMPILL